MMTGYCCCNSTEACGVWLGCAESFNYGPVITAILVITVISLVVAMGSVVSTAYLIRLMRQEKENKQDECKLKSYRKAATLTQNDSGSPHQLPLPGLVNHINTADDEFESRGRNSSTLDPGSKSLKNEAEIESLEGGAATPLRKPRRSRSLPHGKLIKKWPRIRFTRTDPADSSSEKRKKKDKILKGQATPTDLLQNMRTINYELQSKVDFHQNQSETRENNYEDSDARPPVVSIQEGNGSSATNDEISPTSDKKDCPVYYTLEPNTGDDSASEPDDCFDSDVGEEDPDQRKTASAHVPDTLDRMPMYPRSMTMSDAFEKKRKRPSFKIVASTSGKSNEDSKRKIATWNARELTKNRRLLQQQQRQQDRGQNNKYMSRSSEIYERVETAPNLVQLQSYDLSGDVSPAERDGSYSLLSRSLEDGLIGYGDKIEIPGYQKLNVGQENGVMV